MMQYIERTGQIRDFLLSRPDLISRIHDIFLSLASGERKYTALNYGSGRCVYEISRRSVQPVKLIADWDGSGEPTILLKLGCPPHYPIDYETTQVVNRFGSRWLQLQLELGTFEVYHDFIRGAINSVDFKSTEAFKRYKKSLLGLDDGHIRKLLKEKIILDSGLVCSQVERGDFGAIPYFHLVVRCGPWFGVLTEGWPSIIAPLGTARSCYPDNGTDDYAHSRLIDFGPLEEHLCQSTLVNIDAGVDFSWAENYADNLGIRVRGEKYVTSENILFI